MTDIRESKQVFSGTSRGNIVVWLANGSSESSLPKWKPTRLLRLEEEGISSMAENDGFIAIADSQGSVTFFNEELQKLKWVQNFSVGKIYSISFHVEYDNFVKHGSDTILGDFIISHEGPCASLVSFAQGSLETIINCDGASWSYYDVHPVKNEIVLGNIHGLLVTFNYLSNERVSEHHLDNVEDEVTCVRWSGDGGLLALGTRKGNVWLLKSESLDPVKSGSFSYSKGSIRSVEWSQCGQVGIIKYF